jgi:hypothetical protein
MKTNRRIKWEATRAEMIRVFDNMCLPVKDIYAECSDGMWVRKSWQGIGKFGWASKWVKV